MAPTRSEKGKTTPTNRTPIRKKKPGILAAQKQALIDNLQLEITERARKLRAQYNIQAQGLQSRIEIRINRIPKALRNSNMEDLLTKSQAQKPATAGPSQAERINSPHKNIMQEHQIHSRASPSPQRGTKRASDDISGDKENADVENPKKRLRGQAHMPPARTTSKVPPSQVLSPRSANSRTYPLSPVRPMQPPKSFLARPVSPLKMVAPAAPVSRGAEIVAQMVEKAKRGAVATRKATGTKPAVPTAAAAGRGRRTVATQGPKPAVGKGRASNTSESSEASAATVVRKPAAPVKKEPMKKTVMSTIKGMGAQKKKAPAATMTKVSTVAPAGGRVLRKRN